MFLSFLSPMTLGHFPKDSAQAMRKGSCTPVSQRWCARITSKCSTISTKKNTTETKSEWFCSFKLLRTLKDLLKKGHTTLSHLSDATARSVTSNRENPNSSTFATLALRPRPFQPPCWTSASFLKSRTNGTKGSAKVSLVELYPPCLPRFFRQWQQKCG